MNLPLPKDLCNPGMQHFMFAQAWFSDSSASWLLTNYSSAKKDQRDLCLVCVMVNLWCQLSARSFLKNSNIVGNNQFTKICNSQELLWRSVSQKIWIQVKVLLLFWLCSPGKVIKTLSGSFLCRMGDRMNYNSGYHLSRALYMLGTNSTLSAR